MKIFALLVCLAFVYNAPVNTSENTGGKVLAGILSHLASLPLLGPLWLNGAISANQKTGLASTPVGFVPVAISTSSSRWVSKSTVLMSISYTKDTRITSNNTQTRVGIWADQDNMWDLKLSAVDIDVSTAPAIPSDVKQFTRVFRCKTGDRLVSNDFTYLYVKVRGDVNADILSDRFETFDNRWTSKVAGSYFVITCFFQSDQYGVLLPTRKETLVYSDPLPLPVLSGMNSTNKTQ